MNAAQMVAPREDPFVAEFARREAELLDGGPDWLVSARRRAIESYRKRGLPTSKDEDWKYTSLSGLGTTRFSLAARSPPVAPDQLRPFDVAGATRIVFINGRPAPDLSDAAGAIGITTRTLSDVARKEPALARDALSPNGNLPGNVFADLNTAFFQDGAWVDVAPKTVPDRPIHLLHVAVSGPSPQAAHPRTHIRVGEAAEATVIQTFAGIGEGAHLTNALTDITVGPGAALHLHRIQRETMAATHLETTAARLGRGSRFHDHAASFGAALARNDLTVVFEDEGGECELDGLYVASGRQHTDHRTVVDHRKPHCTSRQLYKGVLDENAQGVFYGKVYVRKDAQKTNASQTNKNLLLAETALANSTPALEINADDVKCQHGSTTGQLSEEALFYLQSRGIERERARSLLTYAFAREVLQAVRLEPLRHQLEELLFSRLPHGSRVREALQ